jgi:preprotein translocase subunit SecA
LDDTEDWDFRICETNTLLDFPRERHRRMLVDMAEREADRANKQKWVGVHISLNDVEIAFAQNIDMPGWRHHEDPWHFYARGSIARRQDRWAEEAAQGRQDTPDFDDELLLEDSAIPYMRLADKIGRNDPCPCGSGKKYKKCCMTK